jgi:hypothetical protein
MKVFRRRGAREPGAAGPGAPTYCRNCGMLLHGIAGHWWHAHTGVRGPVPCAGAEPEDRPEPPEPAASAP